MNNSKIRTLEEICDGKMFSINLLGNSYCKLSLNKTTKCDWRAKVKDKNRLYIYLKYISKEEENSYNN